MVRNLVAVEVSQIFELERAELTAVPLLALNVPMVPLHVCFVVSNECESLEAAGTLELCSFQISAMLFSPVLTQLLHSGGCLLAEVAIQYFSTFTPPFTSFPSPTLGCMTNSSQSSKFDQSTFQALVAKSSRTLGVDNPLNQGCLNCKQSEVLFL